MAHLRDWDDERLHRRDGRPAMGRGHLTIFVNIHMYIHLAQALSRAGEDSAASVPWLLKN